MVNEIKQQDKIETFSHDRLPVVILHQIVLQVEGFLLVEKILTYYSYNTIFANYINKL